MKPAVKSTEFIGEPKDGLVVDGEFLGSLDQRFDPEMGENIRMMYETAPELEEEEEMEVVLIGRYICSAECGGHLIFQWFAVD